MKQSTVFIKFIGIILTFFLTAHCVGQEVNWLGVGAHWTYSNTTALGLSLIPLEYQVTSDTVINDINYHTISHNNLKGYFRESSGEVYCIKDGQNTEHLFFDFNLDTGDTLFFTNPFIVSDFPIFYQTPYLVVFSKEEIQLLDGSLVNKMEMRNDDLYYHDFWIANVGSLSSLFLHGLVAASPDLGETNLVCFENENSTLIYEDPIPNMILEFQNLNYENCNWEIITDVNQEIIHENKFKIYPNPNNGNFTINVNEKHHNIKVHLFNTLGQAIEVENIISSNQLIFNLTDIPSGVFWVKLYSGDKIIGVEKMIIFK